MLFHSHLRLAVLPWVMLRTNVLIVMVATLELKFMPCLGQTDDLSLSLSEQFYDNRQKWHKANTETTKSYITNNAYYFSYHSANWWNTRIPLPAIMQNAFSSNVSTISFELTLSSSSSTNTSGIGFVFDKSGDDYNIMYIGEEPSMTFAAIIPRRKKQFLAPIKDGFTKAMTTGSPVRVVIKRKAESYSIYLDDILVLTFVHHTPIRPEELYFTSGDYKINNINFYALKKETLSPVDGDKSFDPSKFKTYALLVGVSTYESKYFTRLNSSINDIDSIGTFLIGPYGGRVAPENISRLAGFEAKREKVLFELKKLAAKATSNDLLMVFLSGHGFASSFYCYNGALAYEEINKILSTSLAKNKLVIVDACQSGFQKPIIAPPNKDNSAQDDVQNAFRFKLAMASSNTNYFTSCDAHESSFDGTVKTNSVFTSALLKATRDRSLGASGQILTIADIYKSVKQYFASWNKQQSEIVVNYGGIYDNLRTPKRMTPRLFPVNSVNNLPFAILP